MINLVSFTESGIKDLEVLRNADLNIIDLKDNEYALRLATLLDLEIYLRVKEVNKGIFSYSIKRDVYSGYEFLIKKIKKGTFVTANEKVYRDLNVNRIEICKDLVTEEGVHISKKEDDDTLSNAKLVFLVGRGIGNKENYLRIKELAKRMGAEVGCTRPVCMNGFESFDNFVGISGKSLNSDLCVTFGVSGSGPLIKGLENVKKVISINNDKNALIFNYSDYKIVKDLNIVLKEMESELK